MKEAASRRVEFSCRAGERLGLEEIAIYPIREGRLLRVDLVAVKPPGCVYRRVDQDQRGHDQTSAAASLEAGAQTHQIRVKRFFTRDNPGVSSLECPTVRLS